MVFYEFVYFSNMFMFVILEVWGPFLPYLAGRWGAWISTVQNVEASFQNGRWELKLVFGPI